MGSLSKLSAVQLGVKASEKLIDNCNISNDDIDLVYFGNVLSAGLGQNIARQISYNINVNAPSTTINRVCGSGMEAIILGAKAIKLNEAHCVLVGGTESMSNSPYLNTNIKRGRKMGHIQIIDSMILDGLTDPFSGKHMGELAENTNTKYKISREMQDEYAIQSYKRSRYADLNNLFKNEIIPIEIKCKNNNIIVDSDEEINKIPDISKLPQLKSVFKTTGTITAGNASTLSDGACVMILVSEYFIKKNKLTPLAKIIDTDVSAGNPNDFTRLPIISVKKLCEKRELLLDDIDLFEINEAFSSVPIMFHLTTGISYDKINILGGSVSMGHPIGCSGTRIVSTLLTGLLNTNKKTGCASICNGGGGASSILIEIIASNSKIL